MKSKYLMESDREASRLLMKSDEGTTREQLIATGLRAGFHALDAGGGAGFVSRIMMSIVGNEGSVTIADLSEERLSVADTQVGHAKNFKTICCDLSKIPVPPNQYDFVFCRFVFEYLENPDQVFMELLRVTKGGGKLVVGDLDHNLMSHYPIDALLEVQLFEVAQKLRDLKLWDAYAGRKIYSRFFAAGLRDIRVRVIPHHLFYGDVGQSDIQNWRAKIDQIRAMVKSGQLSLSFDVDQFAEKFMKFFLDPARFSYTPLILVEGIKGS